MIVGRYVPGGRTAVTFTAGMTHYSYRKFLVFDAIAAITWATYASLLGYFGGRFFHDHVWAAPAPRIRLRVRRRARGRGRPAVAPMNRLAGETSPYLLQHACEPGRLVSVGRRGARPGPRRGPADPALDRLRGVPLVPRDGTRVVRGSPDRARDERELRQRQGRSRGAARPRRRLHGRRRRADRQRRLADDRLPDARRRAVLRRHLLPARAAARPAVVQAGAARRRRGVARPARRGRELGPQPDRPRPPVGAPRAVERAARRDRCWTTRSRTSRRASTRASAGSAARRSSRPRPCSSSCCVAASAR